MRGDVPDCRGAAERLQDVHRRLAEDREDVAVPLGLQALDEEIGGGVGALRAGREWSGWVRC